MRKGLRLFEKFDKLHLEICITDKDRARFEKQYSLATGESAVGKDGYYERELKNKKDAWGIEYRVYFNTNTDWVVDSLTKLGYNVEQDPKKFVSIELNQHHPNHDYKFRVAAAELWWWLVDYGYRIGENEKIPFEVYQKLRGQMAVA
jgi:hypothetical protein